METITINKIGIRQLKCDIEKYAQLQKVLKNQRKTVHFKGERIMEPEEAQYQVYFNTIRLRIMYAAYGLMRGKMFSQIENHYPEENHPLNKYINKINEIIDSFNKEE
jgi:DNA-binding MltR family transcriptional regulator